ncbi:MAG: biotin/lipoyl-binding protein [Pseudomonadales bacterium]|nr:biotin/lipoyl-binding protein [Pseudomonadales bacterium]NIX07896.1 biotin/lipoyl-binding protein [Pseudomonadales bacterium]
MTTLRARALLLAMIFVAVPLDAAARGVSSLGRIEPHDGVFKLVGPSEIAVVAELLVDEGDRIERGEVLARLDTYAIKAADVKRVQVALDHAKRVLKRQQELKKSSFQSEAALDEAQRDVEIYQAELTAARAQLDRASIKAPVDGQVLAVHARQGERIGKLVAKNDVLDLDPVARMDSRVIEVFVLLDEPAIVADLTNLQVDVEFEE